MSGGVFTSVLATAIEESLKEIHKDKSYGESDAVFPKYMKVGRLKGAFRDEMEVAGIGLLQEKVEGQETAIGTIQEGHTTRYLARTFGRRMVFTEEAIEDCKYDDLTNGQRWLTRAAWKTVDYDAANVLIRAWNAAYPIGDGQPLCSANHVLTKGGTFSNTMATPISPSRQAFVVARAQVAKYPSYDGLLEGHTLEKVVFPVDQQSDWDVLLGSPKAPEPGEYNAINVLARSGIKAVPVVYWSTTTTNYLFLTNAEGGPKLLWKRKFKRASWVENSRTVMQNQVTGRWAIGTSNARSVLGVQA